MTPTASKTPPCDDPPDPHGPPAPAGTPRRLLIATTNPHKIAEFHTLLGDGPFTLVDARQVALNPEVAETGATFAENAAIKALAWAEAAHLLTLADDSGLEIDALGGWPGIASARWIGTEVPYTERNRMILLTLADDSGLEIDALGGWPGIASARWIGPEVPYTERNRMILRRLADVPRERRTARYRCAIAVADGWAAPVRVIVAVEGVVEGRIADEARGSGGFGYDPIFEIPDRGRTFGEQSAAEKDEISHRARAARAALAELRQLGVATREPPNV